MDTGEALEIIFELAQENVLDEADCSGSPQLEVQRRIQQEALNVAHDFIVNNFGDD